MHRSPSDQKFIAENGLDLNRSTDLIKYTLYQFAKTVGECELGASFNENCLELRLDQRRTEYVLDDVDDIKIVLAPSGAGKTRMILELLHESLGYYFTVKSSQNDFGSIDLYHCLIYCQNKPENTHLYLSVLYFVRVTVCNHLMSLGFDQPWQILLAQLHPNAFFGIDVFYYLFITLVDEFVIMKIQPKLENCFPFVAIDEIQLSIETAKNHCLPESSNMRPFFSPLVFFTKMFRKFPRFIVAGTGINFELIKDALESSTMKADQRTAYQVLSKRFRPLTKAEVVEYARFVLQERRVEDCEAIVQRISDFNLCHGRARFVAFILDQYKKWGNIECAIAAFIEGVTNVNCSIFPLAFLKRDIDKNGQWLNRVVGNDTISRIIRNGMLDFIMFGQAFLQLQGQDASDAILYGLGFGEVSNNTIDGVRIDELAIMECLRYLMPFNEIVASLAERIASSPKAQMIDYLVEYLVAFALVANTSGLDVARNIKITHRSVADYLRVNDANQVSFPDPMCGADVIYKCVKTMTVYIYQTNFVKGMTKQERVNACNTNDPNLFYCNRTTKTVLKGFEDKHDALGNVIKGKRTLILDELRQLQRDGFTLQQVVFVHTGENQIAKLNGAEVVSKTSHPNFFDYIAQNIWGLLDSVTSKF
ncbi:hypothetical protein ROZALSC1DRAFT_13153 [Rozella allomycis CSF55]|uniref:Uncharacterized protein n=1 Tax=Rozella allomycis (strain CSF55) TaxID=988480 RepID=A0A4P9YKT3_ROZAC|nr:hypothetical protein ROZALSC1DRAFT_13153 [Rozella allomycis CSF55]